MHLKVATFAALTLLSGCRVREQIAWPPTGRDIARVNDGAAANNGWLRVDYVEPIASVENAHVARPTAIESIDADRIAFRTRDGAVQAVPTAMLEGVTVKERGHGAVLGAGIGLATTGIPIGALYLASKVIDQEDGHAIWTCHGDCIVRHLIPALVIPAIIGGVVGYIIGGRRTFQFARAP